MGCALLPTIEVVGAEAIWTIGFGLFDSYYDLMKDCILRICLMKMLSKI